MAILQFSSETTAQILYGYDSVLRDKSPSLQEFIKLVTCYSSVSDVRVEIETNPQKYGKFFALAVRFADHQKGKDIVKMASKVLKKTVCTYSVNPGMRSKLFHALNDAGLKELAGYVGTKPLD